MPLVTSGTFKVVPPDLIIRNLGGSFLNDRGLGIAVDASNNSYVGGRVQFSSGLPAYLAKYNSTGGIEWVSSLETAGSDYIAGIAVDGSNNICVAGNTSGAGAGNHDAMIAKFNSSGALQWVRTLGAASWEYVLRNNDLAKIAVDGSNDIYIAAHSNSTSTLNYDVLIFKYSSAGALQWVRSIASTNTNDYDSAHALMLDGSNNICVAGVTALGSGNRTALIMKLNSTATSITWARSLGGSGEDEAYNMAIDASDNLYIVGRSTTPALTNDRIVAKFNSSGSLQWLRSINADELRDVQVVGSELYILGDDDVTNRDILILNLNTSDGTTNWATALGDGSNSSEGYGLQVSGSYVYLTGQSRVVNPSNIDILFARVPNDGSETGTVGGYTYSDITGSIVNTNESGNLTNTLITGSLTNTDEIGTYTSTDQGPTGTNNIKSGDLINGSPALTETIVS